ncbi:MAG: VanZ family protein [bacterium]
MKPENRLWLVIIIFIFALYASLPLMPVMVRFFYRLVGVRAVRTALNVWLVLGAVFFLAYLSKRLGFFEITVVSFFLLMGIIASIKYSIPEERIHFLEYGILGHLVLKAAGNKRKSGLWFSLLFVIIIGIGDEAMQVFLPNRVGDLKDVYMNIFGGCLGVGINRLLARTRTTNSMIS